MHVIKSIGSYLKVYSENRIVALSVLLSLSGVAQSAVITYTDETTYLTDLSAYTQSAESFEDDSAWGSVRTRGLQAPNVALSITNLGLTWEHRFSSFDLGVTTGDGDAHEGGWQFFAFPHGGYGLSGLDCTAEGACGDGFTVTSAGAGTLFGVGGWFAGSGGPEINFLLDDLLVADAGGAVPNTGWHFFGVIDTDGFTKVDIRDGAGTEGDQNWIWADDFTFGVTAVPLPAALPLFASGMALFGIGGWRRRRQSLATGV